jgi:hypothetical protein
MKKGMQASWRSPRRLEIGTQAESLPDLILA